MPPGLRTASKAICPFVTVRPEALAVTTSTSRSDAKILSIRPTGRGAGPISSRTDATRLVDIRRDLDALPTRARHRLRRGRGGDRRRPAVEPGEPLGAVLVERGGRVPARGAPSAARARLAVAGDAAVSGEGTGR